MSLGLRESQGGRGGERMGERRITEGEMGRERERGRERAMEGGEKEKQR